MTAPALNSVATLIVKPGESVPVEAIGALRAACETAGAGLGETHPLGPEACDLQIGGVPLDELRALAAETLDEYPLDCVVQPPQGRRKRLLVADMDSTMIMVECVDELADFLGVKDRVAEITEAAMRGELDFAQALEARVALLEGLDLATVKRCYAERVELTPGAETLLATMTANGARSVLVSGGFTFFTERVAKRLGFHAHRANRLGLKDGRLDGTVAKPIVDSATKRETLIAERSRLGLEKTAVMAVGDGANDIPMLKEAGLSVAYHAKAKARAAADARIDHGDLTALLYLQGYRREEFRGLETAAFTDADDHPT